MNSRDKKTVKLTDAQAYVLRHLLRTGETARKAQVSQLEKKGLVTFHYTRERQEWGRTVAKMHVVTVLPEGKRIANTQEVLEAAKRFCE